MPITATTQNRRIKKKISIVTLNCLFSNGLVERVCSENVQVVLCIGNLESFILTVDAEKLFSNYYYRFWYGVGD